MAQLGIKVENTFKNKMKSLFCKPHSYKTITNFYGDMINAMSGKKTIRSLQRCTKCGKFRPSEFLDEKCKIINFDIIYEKGNLRLRGE